VFDQKWTCSELWRVTVMLLALVGCSAQRQRDSVVKPSIFGRWQVVSFIMPGVTAMDSTAARAWLGREVTYDPSRAQFGNEECRQPGYRHFLLSGEAFERENLFSPTELGLRRDSVAVVEVTCDGQRAGTGYYLFVESSDAMYTDVDGVYFELRRREAASKDP